MATMFNESKVNEAEEVYKTVSTTPTQKKVIQTLCAKLHEYIPIKEISLRGFALMAARDWQIANKEEAKAVEAMSPSERVKFMEDVLGLMKTKFIKILNDPAKIPDVEKGITSVLEFYKQGFAQR